MSLMNDDRLYEEAYDRVVQEQRLIQLQIDAAQAAGRQYERQRCSQILMVLWEQLHADPAVPRKVVNMLNNTMNEIEGN